MLQDPNDEESVMCWKNEDLKQLFRKNEINVKDLGKLLDEFLIEI